MVCWHNNELFYTIIIDLHTDCIICMCVYRYMQHNDDPTFGDFESFGGWSKPNMKQYSQDSKDCVANLNLDYSV